MIRPADAQGFPFRATIREVGELIGALPLMFGFHPVSSLVLVTHTRSTSAQTGFIRVDLPAPPDVPAVIAQLRDALVRGDAVAVTAVVIDGSSGADGAPHRAVVDALTSGLAEADIKVRHAVWTVGTESHARWQCYDPCHCAGSVPAPDTSPVISALTVAGATTADSRDLLAATLAADPEDQLARRRDLLTRRWSRVSPSPDSAYRVVRDAITAAADDSDLPSLTDEQIVDLAVALSDPTVRDRCLTAAIDTDAEAAERLWTVLARTTPVPQRATPAVLLAMHTYLRGDGVLAAIALDIARNADPDDRLAQALDAALGHGMPPVQLRRFLQAATSSDGTDH